MKYNYWFEVMNLANSQKSLIMRFPEGMLPVQIFLGSDIQGHGVWELEYIDKVLSGESEYEEFTGNACYVEVRKDKTRVEYMFTNNETEEFCEIETSELRELIEIWLKEVKEFYKKQKK